MAAAARGQPITEGRPFFRPRAPIGTVVPFAARASRRSFGKGARATKRLSISTVAGPDEKRFLLFSLSSSNRRRVYNAAASRRLTNDRFYNNWLRPSFQNTKKIKRESLHFVDARIWALNVRIRIAMFYCTV